jgi:hypothetical protein
MASLGMKELMAGANEQADGLNDYEIARMWGVFHSLIFNLRVRAIKKLRRGILADPVLRQLAIDCGCAIPVEKENA